MACMPGTASASHVAWDIDMIARTEFRHVGCLELPAARRYGLR
jgi:hypothetical protein